MRTVVVLLVLVAAVTGAALHQQEVAVPGFGTPVEEAPSGDGPVDGGDGGDGGNDGSGDSGDGEATPAPDGGPSFDVRVVEIQDCGRTCRDVTAEIENVGDEPAENVVVDIEITTDGETIWTGEVEVGTLEPGETFTTTEHVEIGYGDAVAVESNDGWIEIETVVNWDGGSQTFTEKRQVA